MLLPLDLGLRSSGGQLDRTTQRPNIKSFSKNRSEANESKSQKKIPAEKSKSQRINCPSFSSMPLSPNRMGSEGPSGPSKKEIQMSCPFPIVPLSPNCMGSKGLSGPLPLTRDHLDPWLSLALSGDGALSQRHQRYS